MYKRSRYVGAGVTAWFPTNRGDPLKLSVKKKRGRVSRKLPGRWGGKTERALPALLYGDKWLLTCTDNRVAPVDGVP